MLAHYFYLAESDEVVELSTQDPIQQEKDMRIKFKLLLKRTMLRLGILLNALDVKISEPSSLLFDILLPLF